MKIFLNSGHGGSDCGAVGNGLIERDVVWRIGQLVEKYLRATGFEVKLMQYDGLAEICADANAWGADLFISIHCNAANGTAHGTETYTSGGNKSRRLAELIHSRLTKILFGRGVKTAGFYVLKYTAMPAVLVETAFIDNVEDAKLLKEKEDDFARAIACGVTDYYQKEKPLPDVIESPKAAGMLSEHFSAKEFECHCCGQGTVDERLIELLEELRDMANAPIHVNSGYRCRKHNAAVGGLPNSQHVKGTAADITIPNIGYFRAAELVSTLPFDGTGFYGGIGSHIEWFD